MAVQIDSDSIVKVIQPSNDRKFSLEELNNLVEGFIEPLKIGPVWILYDEKAKKNRTEENAVASFFFGLPLYGKVLVVPSQELPDSWDVLDEFDRKYTADDVNNGFLLSLQKSLIQYRVYGVPGHNRLDNLKEAFQGQEEWMYQPPNKAELDENTADFYTQVYEYITKHPDMFKKNIILNKSDLIIKIESQVDRERMLNQMIEFFVEKEEYEKCSSLKSLITF